MYISTTTKQKGFAMLFTVLIVSLILSIAIGISNITFKQTILSSLAKDSQIAFYQADAGIECGMYYDVNQGAFPLGTDPRGALSELWCGNTLYSRNDDQSYKDYLVYYPKIDNLSGPCVTIVFDKATVSGINRVEARGYNICSAHPRQVERALEIRY
jgi:hypothetical protein